MSERLPHPLGSYYPTITPNGLILPQVDKEKAEAEAEEAKTSQLDSELEDLVRPRMSPALKFYLDTLRARQAVLTKRQQRKFYRLDPLLQIAVRRIAHEMRGMS